MAKRANVQSSRPRVNTPSAIDPRPQRIPIAVHVLFGVWIAAMLWFASTYYDQYLDAMQEDRVVEWATVWPFFVAFVMGMRWAIRRRRPFDGLVALFCLFVAGEEFSWGQRLIGFSPPAFFLENNVKQEFTLHNLPHSVQPGTVLMIVLAGYALLVPLSYVPMARRYMDRFGATAPQPALLPWLAAAIALEVWYPYTSTGEWVELLVGALFFVSMRPARIPLWTGLATTAIFGVAMTAVTDSLERGREPARMACARAEVQALADDLAASDAGTPKLWEMQRVHKTIWSATGAGYINPGALHRFNAVSCQGAAGRTPQGRRQFGIDPWGSPYWLLVDREDAPDHQVIVYSFGADRSEDVDDHGVNPQDGDDVVSTPHRHP
jgi:hypothetical protein